LHLYGHLFMQDFNVMMRAFNAQIIHHTDSGNMQERDRVLNQRRILNGDFWRWLLTQENASNYLPRDQIAMTYQCKSL
jgi:hypothetical protein